MPVINVYLPEMSALVLEIPGILPEMKALQENNKRIQSLSN